MDAIILTAGKGTRLLPLTRYLPKPLFPIAGKPLLCHILDSLSESITKVIIVIGHEKDQIQKEISKESYPFEIIWVFQQEQRGTGHAVQLCKEYVTTTNFFMMYGDIFVGKPDLKNIIDFSLKIEKNRGVIATIEVDVPEKYGCLETSNNHLVRIWEKDPHPPSPYINAGFMVLPKSIFNYLDTIEESHRGEVELTEGINALIQAGTIIHTLKIQDYWIDTGYPWDLILANSIGLKSLVSDDKYISPSGVTINKPVKIDSSVVIRSGSYIQDQVMIDKNAIVGPNSFIRSGTYLGKGVRIGNGVEIKNSIILDGSTIGHLSYIGDSIIGRNCNFGAGTKIANLRLDDQSISMNIKGTRVNSNQRKLGIIMGDNVKTGINVSIMPGISIGENSRVGAHTLVTKNIPPNSLLYFDPDEGRVILRENLYG
jgi:bifunctional UDP-N-acetylglucosamine pyrophosphorylase/glucosamine-1-phosphate N-acetyltransferase